MAYASGSGVTGSYNKKQKAVDDYWENYEKYNKPQTTPAKPKTSTKTNQGTKITNPSSYSAPPKTSSTTVTTTSSTPDRDYAKEIEDELRKDNIDWNKVSELGVGRNEKIASGNMDVESTEDLVERLYGNRNATPNKPGTGIIAATSANDIAGVPNKIETVQVEPEVDPMAEYQEYLEQLQEAQRQSRIAALDKAKDTALSNLAGEEAGIAPDYYNQRNAAAAQSDVGALNFAQYMAGRGIKGAAGAMPEIYRNAGLNQQIGALNQQEQAAKDAIARDRTGVQNAYESDVASANADIDAQGLQAYINQMNANRAYALQEAALTGSLNGTPTLAGQQAQQEQQDAQRQQYLDTIGQFSNNYQAEIDRVSSDNDTSNDWQIPYLKAKRQQKITDQAAQAAQAAAAQGEAEQQAWENAFKLFQQVGRITSPQQAQILGIDQNATIADIDIARMNAQTSRMNAQTSAQNAQAAANKQDTPSASDYKTNPDFAEEVAYVNANPNMALSAIQQNATALIQKYGYDGYSVLLKLATPEE